MRRYHDVAAPDITLVLDMKLSNSVLNLFRLGARITLSGNSFQRGTTRFEKSCVLTLRRFRSCFLLRMGNFHVQFLFKFSRFRLFPLVDDAGPDPFRDGALFGKHLFSTISISFNSLNTCIRSPLNLLVSRSVKPRCFNLLGYFILCIWYGTFVALSCTFSNLFLWRSVSRLVLRIQSAVLLRLSRVASKYQGVYI